MRRRLISIIAVMALVVAAGGYAGWYHLRPGSAQTVVVGEDPTILVWQERSGMMALMEATLRYDLATGCLVLGDGSATTGVEWPIGTRPVVRDGLRGVRVGGFLGRFGGTVALEGDRLRLGGGGVGPLTTELAEESGCDYDGRFRTHQVVVLERGFAGS